MADKVISQLIYKLIADEADLVKSLKASEKKLDALGDKFISIGKKATIGLTVPIVAAGTAMVAAAVEAEKANKLLENAITAAGNSGKVSAKNLAAYASELQLVSKYDDEATISAFTLLEQMTALDEQGLRAIMPSIQNFASALDMDLQGATSLVAKSIATDTNALGRYGIEVDSGASKSEKMAQILQGLAKYQGAAAAEAQTFSGRMAILKNQIGDLAEQFGNELLPILSEAIKGISGVVKQFAALDPVQKRTILGMAAVAASIGPVLIGIGNAIRTFSTLGVVLGAASGPVGWITLGVAALAALGLAIYNNTKYLYDYNAALEGTSKATAKVQLKILQTEYEKLSKELAIVKKQQQDAGDVNLRGASGLQDQADALQKVVDQHKARIDALQKEVDAQDNLNLSYGEFTNTTEELTANEKEYAKALDLANGAIEDSKTEEEKLLEQIKILSEFEATSEEDDRKRYLALALLREKLFKLQTEQQAEALRTQREKDIEYNENLKRLGREAAEEGDRLRKESIEAEKKKTEEISGYALDALQSINNFSKIMQNDLSESWDDLAKEVLDLTETIGKATGTQEGYVVAAVAQGLQIIVDIIDGAINYEKNLARSLADTTNEVNRSILDNKIKLLDAELAATISKIDAEEKAALRAAGFIDDTEVQALEKKLAAETDATKKAEIEKELAKSKIQEEFQTKRDEANAAAEKERRRLEHERAIWDRDIMLAKIAIEEEKAISELGWFNQDKKDKVRGLYADLRNSVNAIPIPALAGGGSFIVPSGFERDSFPITTAMAQSGERVTVETPEQQLSGGINLYIDNFFGDDASYRQLARKLASVSPIEELRRG